jgi:hypothetical protein
MPVFVWIATIRRGDLGFPAARENAGSIASSSGSASVTPAPRRNPRRERGRAEGEKKGVVMVNTR